MKTIMNNERRAEAMELEIRLLGAKQEVKDLESRKIAQKKRWLEEDLAALRETMAAEELPTNKEEPVADEEVEQPAEESVEESVEEPVVIEQAIEYRSAKLAVVPELPEQQSDTQEELSSELVEYGIQLARDKYGSKTYEQIQDIINNPKVVVPEKYADPENAQMYRYFVDLIQRTNGKLDEYLEKMGYVQSDIFAEYSNVYLRAYLQATGKLGFLPKELWIDAVLASYSKGMKGGL